MSTPRILQINADGTFDLVCSDSDARATGLTLDDLGESQDFVARLAKAHEAKTAPAPEDIKASLEAQRAQLDALVTAVDAEIQKGTDNVTLAAMLRDGSILTSKDEAAPAVVEPASP